MWDYLISGDFCEFSAEVWHLGNVLIKFLADSDKNIGITHVCTVNIEGELQYF